MLQGIVKGAHFIWLILLILYFSREVYLLFIKWLYPANTSVQFWAIDTATASSLLSALALVVLWVRAQYPERVLKSIAFLALMLWLCSFTWYAWFCERSPFIVRELVYIDLWSIKDIENELTRQFIVAVCLYLFVLIFSIYPFIVGSKSIFQKSSSR